MAIEQKRKIAVAIYIAYMLVFYFIIFAQIEPFASYTSTFGLIGNFLAIGMFYHGIKSHPKELRKPWIWFCATVVLYCVGEALWAIYDEFLGLDPTSPSICDVFYLANSFTSLFAGICYLRQMGIKIKDITFDVVVSLFAVGGLMYNFVLYPIASTWEENAASVIINSVISLIDLSFFVTLILVVFNKDESPIFTKRALVLATAFVGLLAIDQGTMLIDLYGIEMPVWVEPLWAAPMWFLAFASMYPEEYEGIAKHIKLEQVIAYTRILLPYVLTFSIMTLVCLQLNIQHPLFMWAIFLVVLLSIRQILVLMRNKKLVEEIRKNEEKLNLQNFELQKLNKQILRDAEIDFLTQLANRRYIDQTFERLLPPDGVQATLGVLLIDVDKFKQINDKHGHQVGDIVLQSVAHCIKDVVRGEDIAGRFDGDEFIILLPGADAHATGLVAARLMEKTQKSVELIMRNVTLSIGCTSQTFTNATFNVEVLLKEADDALYRAKNNGRNQFAVNDPNA